MSDIKLREYTTMMIRARRIATNALKEGNFCVVIDHALFVQLLDTLDALSCVDTSTHNKITVKVPR